MNAQQRADEDIRRGDFGSARRRLSSAARSLKYSPESCERVARLSVRMNDPVEAGRWYFLCASSDAQADALVDVFVNSCGRDARKVAAALPAKVMQRVRARPDQYPHAATRLEKLGYRLSQSDKDRANRGEDGDSLAASLGCLAVIGALLACMIVGAVTIVRSFIRMW